MTARPFLQRLAVVATLFSSLLPAQPAVIIAVGKAEPDIERGVDARADSTGTVCVKTRAGNGVSVLRGPTKVCSIQKTDIKTIDGRKAAIGIAIPGLGRTEKKYTTIMNELFPLSDFLFSSSTDDGTKSEASALWESFVGGRGSTRVNLKARAMVSRAKDDSPEGLAAAQAKDPLLFDFATAGTLDFNYYLGDDEITLDPDTGLPISDLSIFSDDLRGGAHLDFSAGFTGLSYNGMALNNELFHLTIDSRGIVSSPSDLDIEILMWEGLGLTESFENDLVSYLRSSFSTLSDGSVGLMPGEQIALIGPGSPLTTLTFAYNAGQVSHDSSVVSVSTSVPEPGTITLLLSGGTILFGLRKVRPQK